MKRLLTLSFFALLITVSGCRVIKPGTDTVQTEETKTDYKQQNVDVKGGKVEQSISSEMLIDAMTSYKRDLANGQTPKETPKQSVSDPSGKTQLTYWIDAFGKLQMTCETKEQTVSVLVAEVTRLNKEVTKKTEVEYKVPTWCWVVMAALLIGLIQAIILILIQQRQIKYEKN